MLSIARQSLRATASRRALSTSALRANNITSHGVDPEKAAEELEAEKQKNLAGKQQSTVHEHAPGWNEKVASDSEAVIKSHGDKRSPEELVKDTVEKTKKAHNQ